MVPLKFIFLLPRKGKIVRTMKQNHTKHVYFSVFYPLKMTGGLEIESLGRVYWGELGGGELKWRRIGELAMGRNWYYSSKDKITTMSSMLAWGYIPAESVKIDM